MIKSQRGRKLLLYKGYMYNFGRIHGISTWKCRIRQCNGSCKTRDGKILNEKIHIHSPDLDKAEAFYINQKCRERAIKANEWPRDIINKEMMIPPFGVSRNLSKLRNFVDGLVKHRKKNNIYYDIDDIPARIKQTYSNEEFLLYDSGINDPNRILIFTTEIHLAYLEKSEAWYCDGTFKVTPSDHKQLYTIMGMLNGSIYPFIYILMKNKSNVGYEKAFDYLKRKIKNELKYITINFEMAAYIAFTGIFTNTAVCGCFSHFCQIIYKKIQRNKLVQLYRTNPIFCEGCKMMISITYVPRSVIMEYINSLNTLIYSNTNYNELKILWEDMKKTYFNIEFINNSKPSIFQ